MNVIEHIAGRIGVSQRTVAAVLSGESQPTRRSAAARAARIRQAAEELGYRPSAAARAIRTGRLGQVALLAGTGRSTSIVPYDAQWAMVGALEAAGSHLVVTRLPDADLSNETRLPRVLSEHCCDGLLIAYTHQIPPEMMEIIDRHHIPAIWLNTKRDHDCVHHDDFAAGRRAGQRLLQKGYRRLAYVDFSYSADQLATAHYSTIDRQAGFEAALAQAGLTPRIVRLDGVENTMANRHRLAEALLDSPDCPDALFAYSDGAAAPLHWQAMRRGRTLPTIDVADAPHVHGEQPADTVYLDQIELGRAAVRMLLARIDNPNVPQPSQRIAPRDDFHADEAWPLSQQKPL